MGESLVRHGGRVLRELRAFLLLFGKAFLETVIYIYICAVGVNEGRHTVAPGAREGLGVA